MKKLFLIVALLLTPVMASATTTTHANDNVVNWNGYGVDARDDIGNPKLTGMTVNYGSRINTVTLHTSRHSRFQYFSNLFIDTLSDGEWNYMVTNDGRRSALYKVSDDYKYTLAQVGRKGHPNGIDSEYLEFVAYMDTTLTGNYGHGYDEMYDFSDLSIFANGFSIGYAPYCANDVLYSTFDRWTSDGGGGIGGGGSGGTNPSTPVPEPGTMLLFGAGIAGLASIGRKKRKG